MSDYIFGYSEVIDWKKAFRLFTSGICNSARSFQYNLVEIGGPFPGMMLCVELSPQLILCGGSSGTLHGFDRQTKKLLHTYNYGGSNIRAVRFDRTRVYSGSADHSWCAACEYIPDVWSYTVLQAYS
jgi:hypothetical protein